MTSIAENWLAIEPLLVERVKAQVTGLRAVYTASELDALEGPSDPRAGAFPAAHVLYAGDQLVPGEGDNGELQVFDQLWCVAIVAVNSRGAAALRAEVGPLVSATIRCVSGWECGLRGVRPFRRARVSNMPRFNPNKKAIYPLFFAARTFA